MRGRRPAVLLAVTGACSVLAATVLGAAGIPDWRLKLAAAAGGALAAYAGGLVQIRLGDTLGRRAEDRAAIARSVFTPGGRPPLVRDVADPVRIGVHAAARLPGHDDGAGRVPPYVPRDVDPALREALRQGGFVLLAGDAAAGKTRTAYEGMRAVLPGHLFIAPGGAADVTAALTVARAERACVLWLDNLPQFLGGISAGAIAALLDGRDHHRVVLATVRSAAESRMLVTARSMPGSQLIRDDQAVLEQADQRIVVSRVFSAPELARAAALAPADARLAAALATPGPYGVAEYLSSGPQLHVEWDDAWERGTHPRAAALIAAAVDCRRAAFAAPLPRELLDELHEDYLDGRGGLALRPEPVRAAWKWAIDLRDSGSSPLWPAGHGTYHVFDYLVDVLDRPSAEPVPETSVRAALRFAGPPDAVRIAATAWYQNRPELAVDGLRRAYEALLERDGPDAPATLTARSDLAVIRQDLGMLPDAEAEYLAILTARERMLGDTDPATLASRNNFATVLHTKGNLVRAEAEYRAIAQIRTASLGPEHEDTLNSRNNLGVVLIDLGRQAEAEAELADVVRLRSLVLGDNHPATVISRRNLAVARGERPAWQDFGQ